MRNLYINIKRGTSTTDTSHDLNKNYAERDIIRPQHIETCTLGNSMDALNFDTCKERWIVKTSFNTYLKFTTLDTKAFFNLSSNAFAEHSIKTKDLVSNEINPQIKNINTFRRDSHLIGPYSSEMVNNSSNRPPKPQD